MCLVDLPFALMRFDYEKNVFKSTNIHSDCQYTLCYNYIVPHLLQEESHIPYLLNMPFFQSRDSHLNPPNRTRVHRELNIIVFTQQFLIFRSDM